MRAGIVAVGTELLRWGRRDSNSEWLTEQLQREGFEVVSSALAADEVEAIERALGAACGSCSVVVVSGGLGPTEDDRTRDALARAAGKELETDAAQQARLREFFEARGRTYHEVQDRQARRPRGSDWIDNPVGTAPGILLQVGRCRVFALPGVPAELKAMFLESVRPKLPRAGKRCLARRTLRVAGRTESSVDGQLRDLYDTPGAYVTILTGREGIELRLLTEGADREQARDRLARLEQLMSGRLGSDLYGRDDDTLPRVVGKRLLALHRSLATAESCTAGLLSAAITAVPGSSGWYRGGLVAYSDEVKVGLAGLEPGLIREHGAVSEPVARALAGAARDRCGADYGVGVTGIAGPGGGTPDKPIGLVHVAIEGPGKADHLELRLIGDRDLIRRRTVVAALDRLRRVL